MRGFALVVVAILGCSFEGTAATEDGDGSGDCRWSARAFFDACQADSREFSPPAAGLVEIREDTVFSTTTGLFEAGDVPLFESRPTTLGGTAVHLWKVDDLSITGELRLVGDVPLAIVAFGEITISGTVITSSLWEAAPDLTFGGSFESGAGAADCDDLRGTSNQEGGGGGGGAGFGEAGGAGGQGRRNDQMTDGGPAGRAISLQELGGLRGGCRGGQGGMADIGVLSDPSPGGGALLLSAFRSVTVTGAGVVSANGAAGIGQYEPRRNGAGGAGSGGLIVLEAPSIDVSGRLFANGGGGGGGSNTRSMSVPANRAILSGQNGQRSSSQALGADGQASTEIDDGGDGGSLVAPATDGQDGDRGGGGGGGGVGYILYVSETTTAISANTPIIASPTPIPVTPMLEPHL